MKFSLPSLLFFKKPSVLLVVTTTLFVLFFYNILLKSNFQQAEKDIGQYIDLWKYEISENLFHNKNPDLVEKLVTGLQIFPVTKYQVFEGSRLAVSWPDKYDGQKISAQKVECPHSLERFLTLRGLQLGTIKVCLSSGQISQATLLSPLFVLIIALVASLLLFMAFSPLLGYKKSLLSTLTTLHQWTQDPQKKLDVKLEDSVSKNLIGLVKQGVDSRLALQEVQGALSAEKQISKITKQVAHDIRSPVMSLNLAL